MYLKTVKKKFIEELTVANIVLTAGMGLIFHFVIPTWYFVWFPIIPVFFYLFGFLYIFMFAFGYELGTDKIAMTYLICKVLKLILSALILVSYGFVIKEDVVAFVAAFVFYYFAFLVFETRFFLRFEAKLKLSKQVKNEKNTVHSIDAAAVVGNSDNDAEGGDRR
ncbi:MULTISPECIES: hypothetical protein [Bacteroides]|uniref:hypothetical protein n=1 Tax=Bacteroides TaxID=816 RepID=UPI000B3719B1|nr:MULTISPECIES: hypothetical protein [Bacteroides]MBM6944902.1 hypothetical protein [Bacteroides gallinaceum]OUO57969.1 hypothetical protein B5F78_07510 [Bacteroides sp. An279]